MPGLSQPEIDTGAALTPRDALDHSWDWFKHHADQRLTMIRFAVLVAGGVAAGVVYLEREKAFFLCVLLSAFGALVSYCFARLDARTSDLIKAGEQALIVAEQNLANVTAIPQVNICVEANRRNSKMLYTYRENIRMILYSLVVLYTVSIFYFALNWLKG